MVVEFRRRKRVIFKCSRANHLQEFRLGRGIGMTTGFAALNFIRLITGLEFGLPMAVDHSAIQNHSGIFRDVLLGQIRADGGFRVLIF